jgi:hypothetical protein
VAVTELLIPLRVTLLPAELQIRFGRRTRFRIPLRHIARAYARQYQPLKEYGGWGIRNGREGRAFTLGGKEGVQLVLRSGTRVLVGSRQAEELASAIRRITGCLGDPETDTATTVAVHTEVVEVIEVVEVVEEFEENADVRDVADVADVAEPTAAPKAENGIDADPEDRYEV